MNTKIPVPSLDVGIQCSIEQTMPLEQLQHDDSKSDEVQKSCEAMISIILAWFQCTCLFNSGTRARLKSSYTHHRIYDCIVD